MGKLGGNARRAVDWISGEFREDPAVTVGFLVASASQKFGLSPDELNFVCRLLEGGPWH